MLLQRLVLWLHVIAVVFWIGGTFFLFFFAKYIRKYDDDNGTDLIKLVNTKFRKGTWHAIFVVFFTGILNMYYMGVFYDLAGFLRMNSYMTAKLVIIAVMLTIKILHDHVIGPRALPAKKEGRMGYFNAAMFMGRLNLLLGFIVIYLALFIR